VIRQTLESQQFSNLDKKIALLEYEHNENENKEVETWLSEFDKLMAQPNLRDFFFNNILKNQKHPAFYRNLFDLLYPSECDIFDCQKTFCQSFSEATNKQKKNLFTSHIIKISDKTDKDDIPYS